MNWSTTPTELEKRAEELYKELTEKQKELADIGRQMGKIDNVKDYELKTADGGSVKLSELFGDKNDLIIVHNMGKSCPYCTLWADGFIGFTNHLNDRAAFVLVSPDEPSEMKEFAEGRGWNFRTVSAHDSDFVKDMGFQTPENFYVPAFSTFRKDEDGTIRRVAKDWFGPGDAYASIWHLFDRLEGGTGEWGPKYSYA